MARLRREIEEVKEEVGKRNVAVAGEADDQNGDSGLVAKDSAAELSRILDSISSHQGSQKETSATRFVKALSSTISTSSPPLPQVAPQKAGDPATYTVTYAPDYQQKHALAKAADFDSRLTLLENSLGINLATIPSLDSKGVPTAILPTIDNLQRQVSILSESSPSSLDSISRRVRTLIQESERLDEARRSAKVAQDELRASGGDVNVAEGSELGDSEQVAKINALYGTLSTIESLSPLLPSLLDRLRSLRAIHADAATASQNLERIAKRQEDMEVEIKKWQQGLEKIEDAMKQGEETIGGNMKVVEGWVKELEEKMEAMGQ
jgi:nuclear migration protein JNM1